VPLRPGGVVHADGVIRRSPRLLLLVVALLAAACGDDDGPEATDGNGSGATTAVAGEETDDGSDEALTLGDEAVIEYRYGDSSVPPEYHRSYTVTVDREQIEFVVDSYGEVLHEATETTPPEVWEELAGSVSDVVGLEVDDADECAGGTSRSIEIVDGAETVVDLGFGVCGTAGARAADALGAYIDPALEVIPDWSEHLSVD
jgi:hypothetical protein